MKRNRIIYLLLCISAVVLASFYGGPVSYSLLFGLLLIAPISLVYLLFVYAFFRLYQVIGVKHITAYEPVPYYFVLQNEYLLNFCNISINMYSTFSYIEDFDQEKGKTSTAAGTSSKYELLPGESVRYDTSLICRYRGDYFIGIKEITIIDFFKLFKITYRVPEPINAVVSPRIIKLDSLKSIPDITLSSFKENPSLSTDFDAAVRDYVPGDLLKGINWKATAKTGKLKSRLTYGEQRQGISLFLDTNRISEDEYDFIPVENKCLEIILALTDYFSTFSVPVTFHYNQSVPSTATCSMAHEMEEFRLAVSNVKFRTGENSAVFLDSLINGTSFGNCLVAFLVITGADAELNKALYALSLLGINIVVYYVGYNPRTEDIMELQNLRVIPIHPEDDLETVL
ncbi:MAG: DUF58 domain-containing protein [Lachnospiraceae bacterium]|nr:DUF58 domain-containing protein [Lachnospiraceae bacterium]